MTVSPGRSKTAVASASCPVGRYDVACSLSHQGGSPSSAAHRPCLGHDRAVVASDGRVEVHGGVPGVVGEDHGSAAEEVQLGVDPSAVKVVGEAFEGVLELTAAEERPVHARARS